MKRNNKYTQTLIVALCAAIFIFASTARAATFTVNQAGDAGNGTCTSTACTLRDAVAAANAVATDDVINFAAGLTTITLVNPDIAIANNGSLTINGLGANVLTIDGSGGQNRIFFINQSAVVTITDVKLTGGNAAGAGANGDGGAIFADQQSTLTLDRVQVTGNKGAANGGGVFGYAQTSIIRNSTFSNNTANNGGGFYNAFGGVTVANSTFSGNSAGIGGGIFLESAGTTLRSVTVTLNSVGSNVFSGSAGGLYSNNGSLDLGNSIIAGNTSNGSEPDIRSNAITTSGYNLIGINQGVETVFPAGNPNANKDIVGTSTSPINPQLDGLTLAMGGTTPTHPLRSNSPAIDTGNGFGSKTDQRGFTRPVGTAKVTGGDGSDIGAFEVQAPTAAPVILGGRVMTASGRGIRNVRISLTDRNGNIQIAISNAFGYYHFANVKVGETYILNVTSKQYIFDNPTQVLSVTEEMSEVNFTASTRKGFKLGR